MVLELDLRPAAASDDVTDTVHYGEFADALVAIVAGEPVNLIETLAARLADACLADLRADGVVTVHKPSAPIRTRSPTWPSTLRRSVSSYEHRVLRWAPTSVTGSRTCAAP